MKPTVSLGRWLGVPVGLHYSWFLIAWLVTFSLASQFSRLNPAWTPALLWTLALATALLFFVSIVLHELAHATVARFSGVPVRGITLFALGGVAEMERDAATPGKELAIALAGPAASVGIGVFCQAIAGPQATTVGAAPSPLAAVLGWLGYINIVLAVFNLIPGYPLDGGRVLRAVAWRVTGNVDRATRIAARTGMAFGFFFIAIGLIGVFTRGDFGGLWLALIGWFLFDVARAQYATTMIASGLQNLRVADIMAHECLTADADMSIQTFVDEHLLRTAERCFAVRRSGEIVGLVTPHEIKSVDRAQWRERTLGDVMRPLESLHAVAPEAPATAALLVMGRDHVSQVPVLAKGHFEGVVTHSQIIQLLQLRAELTS